jgi:thiol-disulfide isomerase/thioredoxin
MRSVAPGVLIALVLLGCKRESEPAQRVPAPMPVPVAALDAAAAGPTWYRAALRGADGTEAYFFLGVPAPGAAGGAVFKVGAHEVRSDATFDGKTLKIPMDVHQTAVEGTVGADGTLSGTFSASWRAFGAASLPLAGTKVDAPAPSALATVGSAGGTALDLGEPRTVWRLAMTESGVGKLVVDQVAPGDFTGVLRFDTGNTIYLAGNGRGDTAVLSGFDGTSGYRLELALGADRKRAQGKWISGHRFDWRETFTATRGADFPFAAKARARRPGAKIGLPDHPALAALEPGPLLVELAGSWCSTCRYVAPFLVELHREYAPRGLRMVTLLYEFTDDPEADAKQAEAFKQTYGVTWPVVPIAGDLDDFTEIMPSGLADLHPAGFPVTLFLAADRSLVALHAGFPAPDAAERPRVEAELRGHAEALLGGPRLKD